MSIESVMLSNHLILCCPFLFSYTISLILNMNQELLLVPFKRWENQGWEKEDTMLQNGEFQILDLASWISEPKATQSSFTLLTPCVTQVPSTFKQVVDSSAMHLVCLESTDGCPNVKVIASMRLLITLRIFYETCGLCILHFAAKIDSNIYKVPWGLSSCENCIMHPHCPWGGSHHSSSCWTPRCFRWIHLSYWSIHAAIDLQQSHCFCFPWCRQDKAGVPYANKFIISFRTAALVSPLKEFVTGFLGELVKGCTWSYTKQSQCHFPAPRDQSWPHPPPPQREFPVYLGHICVRGFSSLVRVLFPKLGAIFHLLSGRSNYHVSCSFPF